MIGRPTQEALMTRFSLLSALVFGLQMTSACGGGATDDPAQDAALDVVADVPVSEANIVLNEVAPAGDPSDWIELYNPGAESVDLGGWTLTDNDPTHTHVFPGGQTIAAGAYMLLLRGEAGGPTFGFGPMDAASLYDDSGGLVDRVEWVEGEVPQGTSYGRIPNAEGAFQTLIGPTPAAENIPNPDWSCGDGTKDLDEVCDSQDLVGGHCEAHGLAGEGIACAADCLSYDTSGCVARSQEVVVNEASALDDDPIELFNPGTEAVDLSGWTLTDENEAAVDGAYVFAGGTELGAGDYLVLYKDSDHLFGLGGADAVRLRDESGLLIDELGWPSGGAALSFCRVPNGTGAGQVCDALTLGSTNSP
jgi:hypothetical protein